MSYSDDDQRTLAAMMGDTYPFGKMQTVHIATEDGEILDTVTGPHQMPFPYNEACFKAVTISNEHHMILYLLDENKVRCGQVDGGMYTPIELMKDK